MCWCVYRSSVYARARTVCYNAIAVRRETNLRTSDRGGENLSLSVSRSARGLSLSLSLSLLAAAQPLARWSATGFSRLAPSLSCVPSLFPRVYWSLPRSLRQQYVYTRAYLQNEALGLNARRLPAPLVRCMWSGPRAPSISAAVLVHVHFYAK